jgi:hypothetical protein
MHNNRGGVEADSCKVAALFMSVSAYSPMREPEPAANNTAPTVTRLYKPPPPLRMQPMISLRSKMIWPMLPQWQCWALQPAAPQQQPPAPAANNNMFANLNIAGGHAPAFTFGQQQ